MRIIENTADLTALCQELSKQEFITVDSEFVREKTYFSQLCLIQLGWIDDAAIVDPLAADIDLSSLFDLMQNKNVLKVFHSARQDIEIFYNQTGKLPYPVFDTQIAAMACGFGTSVSYDTLVRGITKVELDKSSRLTDWSKRPLDTKQLEYALRDVTFLIPCYQYLADYMKKNNRENWADEELAALLDENLYKTDPENAWQKIRHSAHSPQFLSVLKELAAWRENRAINANIPRRTIMKDEILLNIAASAPKNIDELSHVRNIRADIYKGKLGPEIVEAVKKALQSSSGQELRKIDREKQVLIPGSANALMEVLRLLLKIKCEQNKVAEHLVASEKDLRNIACGNNDKINPALQGWRYDVYGKYALAFRKGNACIRYDSSAKKIIIE